MGQVLDTLVSVSLRQTYQYDGTGPVQAVYRFPMDADAAVNGLRVRVGDRVIDGVVREKAEAKAAYTAAVAAGHGAYLVEESAASADVFVISVGNLLPGETVDVEVSYVATLKREGSEVRFYVPTGIAPRYMATPLGNLNENMLPAGRTGTLELCVCVS